MTNEQAIEVLRSMVAGKTFYYTAVDREEALDAAIAALAPNADRWWRTYDAALTGMHAYSADGSAYTVPGAHNRAVDAANLAHGPLVKP